MSTCDSVTGPIPEQPWNALRRELDGKPLCQRERQVLELIAQGSSNNEIACALGIAIETVKFYVRRLLAKLGARSRTHAVALAIVGGALSAQAELSLEPVGRWYALRHQGRSGGNVVEPAAASSLKV